MCISNIVWNHLLGQNICDVDKKLCNFYKIIVLSRFYFDGCDLNYSLLIQLCCMHSWKFYITGLVTIHTIDQRRFRPELICTVRQHARVKQDGYYAPFHDLQVAVA